MAITKRTRAWPGEGNLSNLGPIKWEIDRRGDEQVVKEIHNVVVYRFTVGDVEDPDLYASEPLYKWQNSDAGKFIMENAEEQPSWHRQLDHAAFGYQYAIVAKLEKKKLSEYLLRWGNK